MVTATDRERAAPTAPPFVATVLLAFDLSFAAARPRGQPRRTAKREAMASNGFECQMPSSIG
jgi:hypothetical protein